LTPGRGGKLIRVRRFNLACAALAVAASGVAPFACSSPAAPLGAGSQCFQTTDCEPGLFCVEQPGQQSTCSTNLAPTVSTEEGGAEAAAAMEPSSDGGDAASPGEGGGSDGSKAPPPATDGAPAPDVGTQSQPDPGAPRDAQPPPKEAAPQEAAPPDADRGSSSGG
jgi:hypothetical protein